jgi:hypothetical protein
MYRGSTFGVGLCLILGLGLGARPVGAQWREFPRLQLAARQEKPNRNNFDPDSKPNNGGVVKPQAQPNLRGMAGLPPRWIESLRELSPEEQERFLQNNRAFQNLGPLRQAQIRKNLENWNKLSPTERDAIRDREQIFERMTPEQRVYLRDTLLPRWQQMPQERRQLINGRLHVLQQMGPSAQQAALADPKFMQGLSPDEQSMLRDLNSFRNPNVQ